jgi:hypothetical protein
MPRVLFVTAAVVAAVIFFALATLPPRPQAVDTSGIDADLIRRTIRGAYHIHTSRSDGASDKAAIAAAASRAGLQFIILTDHGDGTLPSDPPAYFSGVLSIDGVEISTNGGHYVALGMAPSPYPLGGEPSAVVEDVARLGGFGIAAHPDSPKASLAWSDWEAPIDGVEWLNADSEWRDESRVTLVRTFFNYLVRPAPALASMLDRPVTTLKRWDELTQRRPVVALAAHDAHGGIGRGMEETGARRPTLGHIPSYEASFRMFSDNIILDAPLTGNPAADARVIVDAIRQGRVFTVVTAIAAPGYVDLRAGKGTVSVKASIPRDAELVVVGNGRELAHAAMPEAVSRLAPGVTAARVEVRVAGSPGSPPVPWLVTNPVYFLPRPLAPASIPPPAGIAVPLSGEPSWHIEKDPRSVATLTTSARQLSLEYTLAPGARASQFVAVGADVKGGLSGLEQLLFSASARRPSRVSAQLRYAQRGGERWGSSLYVDSTPREIVVPIDRMRPLDRQAGSAPDPAGASSLLFVVDLTNAKPGDSNSFSITAVRIAARSPAAPR